ncbi:hypothetical protein IMZ48_30525, partial [Candidatus Bathyarchaeota archaeon]|nr:hypothetical protein [Candidatus Bathyarchaeota archaeon]
VDFFAQLLVAIERDDTEVEHMAAYISEIALYHRDFVSTRPSIMARSSLALARAILGRPEVTDGEWGHTENVTLVSLSQHLHQPSASLGKKYSSQSYSRVTQTLAEFMRQQANITRRAGPQSVAQAASPPSEDASVFATPHGKGGSAVKGFDGYMTPPITPDGAHFDNNGAGRDYAIAPRCPTTPTPPSQTQARYTMAMEYQ